VFCTSNFLAAHGPVLRYLRWASKIQRTIRLWKVLANISTSVDWPSLIGCLWPNTSLYLQHMCSILSDLKQALEIILEVQTKRSNENITFQLTKHVYLFISPWTPLTFKSHNFFNFLFILNYLKCYRCIIWKFIYHIRTLIATEHHTRKFLSVQESAL